MTAQTHEAYLSGFSKQGESAPAWLADLRRRLIDLLAALEAGLDFVEDEVPTLSPDSFRNQLKFIQGELKDES